MFFADTKANAKKPKELALPHQLMTQTTVCC